MSAKSVIGVIIVAILIGVLYVVFEKNFLGGESLRDSKSSSAQEVSKNNSQAAAKEEPSLIKYPTPQPSAAAITESSDMLDEAKSLEMRDYSGMFEELKDTVSSQ